MGLLIVVMVAVLKILVKAGSKPCLLKYKMFLRNDSYCYWTSRIIISFLAYILREPFDPIRDSIECPEGVWRFSEKQRYLNNPDQK